MKIAILAARLPPANDGVGDHADKLASILVESGHEVIVVSAGSAESRSSYEIRLVGKTWGVIESLRAVWILRRLAIQAVVVEYTPFLYGVRSQAALAVLVAARAFQIRSAIIVHECFYESRSSAVGSVWKARLLAIRDVLTISSAYLVALPSAARGVLVLKRIPSIRGRLIVVPIGANVEPPVTYRRNIDPSITLVCFGVVMRRRRLEICIAALARVVAEGVNVRLHIIGRIHDAAYASMITQLARNANIADRVTFRGALSREAITYAFSKATAAIHTAAEGSIPSSGSLLALLAHGVPTVALRTDFDDEVFVGTVAFAGDETELARSLSSIASDERAALQLSDAGRECYAKHFAWTTAASRLQQALVIVGSRTRRSQL